jgi:hypothetical protein
MSEARTAYSPKVWDRFCFKSAGRELMQIKRAALVADAPQRELKFSKRQTAQRSNRLQLAARPGEVFRRTLHQA